ncbi:MAG TPA: hypothetical protein DCQ06_10735 [Myxococcales bacterium]|nr:hypothetical protein [Myxococcales bacterium]HAN32062.1 hypothetical protein [Myxococcales bacterium]
MSLPGLAASGTQRQEPLLVHEAGGKCTDGHLNSLRWNQRKPTFKGIVCAATEVWQEAIERSSWSAMQALHSAC